MLANTGNQKSTRYAASSVLRAWQSQSPRIGNLLITTVLEVGTPSDRGKRCRVLPFRFPYGSGRRSDNRFERITFTLHNIQFARFPARHYLSSE